ncbi:hypothetical protein ASPCADRAFT_203393 [Aspergillus carbonarius ITEM 5010]|uniref:Uncharacterized protein n=1 Tax=Aspergillus carbonarius (strain ITEM 5010) TaxID=602072 RepID=A0A1R3RYV9_ASPC5|nr:hypothetical protein ASPCADRAFT_203393 [Aspergillus carbonarius ITEM 5010]
MEALSTPRDRPLSLAKSYRRRRVSTPESLGVTAKSCLDLAGGDGPTGESVLAMMMAITSTRLPPATPRTGPIHTAGSK